MRVNSVIKSFMLSVKDHDRIGKDDEIGYINFLTASFELNEGKSGWFALSPSKKLMRKHPDSTGEVQLSFFYQKVG